VADDGAPADMVVAVARSVLADEPGVAVEYVALVDPQSFDAVDTDRLDADHVDALTDDGRDALVVVAARVGGTRLIDNEPVRLRGSAMPPGAPMRPRTAT
jgi:pantoate--beta-alanine ligase